MTLRYERGRMIPDERPNTGHVWPVGRETGQPLAPLVGKNGLISNRRPYRAIRTAARTLRRAADLLDGLLSP